MGPALHAQLTRCRHELPLVVVDGLPGDGAELRPDELRQMAAALLAIAADAEGLPTKGKRFLPVRRRYPVEVTP